jgi:hypothetical protein
VPTGPGFDAGRILDAAARDSEPAQVRASVPPLAAVLPAETRAQGGVATLFDLDDEPETDDAGLHEVTLQLTDEEYARLLLRSRAVGSSPEDLLRRLI